MDSLHRRHHRCPDRCGLPYRLCLAGQDHGVALRHFAPPPPEVFAALADVKRLPEWNRNTEKVELAPSVNGKETTKQTFKGGMTMTIVTAESAPPRHLVRTMGDDGGPFVGSWTYDITPAEGGGSTIVLTEVAEFKNPLFRIMTRIFGQTKYIDEHLEDLAKKFGETATIR